MERRGADPGEGAGGNLRVSADGMPGSRESNASVCPAGVGEFVRAPVVRR